MRALTEQDRQCLGVHVDDVVDIKYWADTMMNDYQYTFRDGSFAFYNLNSKDFVQINGHLQNRGVTCLPEILPMPKQI
jgi:hypothetical protein